MQKLLIGTSVYLFRPGRKVSVVSDDGRTAVDVKRAMALIQDLGYLVLTRSVTGAVVAIQKPEKPLRNQASQTTTTEMIYGRRVPIHHPRCLLWAT